MPTIDQNPFEGINPVDASDPAAAGGATVTITDVNAVRISSYGTNSFNIANTGDKRIAAVFLDIQDAVFKDAVFDPEGLAGDSVPGIRSGVGFGDRGETGAVVVPNLPGDPGITDTFYGEGGAAGYKGLLLQFDPNDDNGFDPGENVTFGVDIDPNSIAGLPQKPIDVNGADPRLLNWDMGGVSGAELSNSIVRVLFSDGTQSSGELMTTGNAGGSQAVIDQAQVPVTVSLTVNSAGAGESGIYNEGGTESVVVGGPAGQTVRVSMVVGFSQPFDYVAPDGTPVSANAALEASQDPFGANNAIKIIHKTVTLTGEPTDIGSQFNFTPELGSATHDGSDQLPVAFFAAAIDEAGSPMGPVTDPIYLKNAQAEKPTPVVVNALSELTQIALQGVDLNNPTTINVGADGKLYVTQQDGLLIILDIEQQVSFNDDGLKIVTWSVVERTDVTLIQDIPNHNDQGEFQGDINTRQVTGAVTTVDENGNVMLYVTSSDPRIGGAAGGKDLNLDTNSGVISRLQQAVNANGELILDGNGKAVWEKVDLVRGLPRSEENHAINGLEVAVDASGNNVLVVAVGGNTNTGAPGNNFAYTPEYYYSGSIISVNLDKLADLEVAGGVKVYEPGDGSTHRFIHDLPTLDDPTRANDITGADLAGDGTSTSDVFGGNDGLNQAVHDPSGVVTLIAVGFRNHYDVTVTESGAIYTADNGSNTGWGGRPLNAAGEIIVDDDNDGLADNGPAANIASEIGDVNTGDELHRVVDNFFNQQIAGDLYYGGHPNFYRALGPDAGFYLYASKGNEFGVPGGTPLAILDGELVPTSAPVDLADEISNLATLNPVDKEGAPFLDPRQEVFLSPLARAFGITDSPNGALWTWSSSTNGIDEYTGEGELRGKILTVSFNGNIYALDIGDDGEVDGFEQRGLTSTPLDLVSQGPDDPYPGAIFVAAYGADQIVILTPEETVGLTPNPNDRDNDGIDDSIDPFAADPNNGLADVLNAGEFFTWSFVNGPNAIPPNDRPELYDGTFGLFNGGDIGFTGLMTNRAGLPENLIDEDNILYGGAPGILQVKSVEFGDPSTQTQRNGLQFGISVGGDLKQFSVRSEIDNFLDEISSISAEETLTQGIFLGSGDQNNYVSLALVRRSDNTVGFEVASQFAFDFAGEQPVTKMFYEVPELAGAVATNTLDLGFDVVVDTGAVTPTWTYRLGTDQIETGGVGAPVLLAGDALKALSGELVLADDTGGQKPTGLAVGILSSRTELPKGDVVAAFSAGGDESLATTIDGQGVIFLPEDAISGLELVGNSQISTVSENISISNTMLDELFTEQRNATAPGDDWGYQLDVPDGTYIVDLYLAETSGIVANPGGRVFDIEIEGALADTNVDIFSLTGSVNKAIILSYSVAVTDGVLDINFKSELREAKVNAVLVRESNNTGTFAADWDDITIEGFGNSTADATAPTATITFSDASTASDTPLAVTVRYADDRALDIDTIGLDDLQIVSDGVPIELLSEDLVVAGDTKTATATYEIRPVGGWTSKPIDFLVMDAAIADLSGNTNVAVSAIYTPDSPPGPQPTTIVRWNAGSDSVAATDGGLDWTNDPTVIVSGLGQESDPSPVGVNYSELGDFALLEDDAPAALFTEERWLKGPGPLSLEFDISESGPGTYAVRLLMADQWFATNDPGERVFDVTIEDTLAFESIDLSQVLGHRVAGVYEWIGDVSDNAINIDFVRQIENPLINAVEIIRLGPLNSAPELVDSLTTLNVDEGGTVVFDATSAFIDADDAPLTYQLGSSAPSFVSIDEATGILTIKPEDGDSGSYDIEIIASDGDADSEPLSISLTVADTVSEAVIVRWNAGSMSIAATDGGLDWTNDPNVIVSGLGQESDPSPVGVTYSELDDFTLLEDDAPAELFNEERWLKGPGPLELEFDVTGNGAGLYAVRLFMADQWIGTNETGDRIFDVFIEGELAFESIDLTDTLGHRIAGVYEWIGEIDDDVVDIDFTRIVENPLINAVEIVRLPDTPSPLVAETNPTSDDLLV